MAMSEWGFERQADRRREARNKRRGKRKKKRQRRERAVHGGHFYEERMLHS